MLLGSIGHQIFPTELTDAPAQHLAKADERACQQDDRYACGQHDDVTMPVLKQEMHARSLRGCDGR